MKNLFLVGVSAVLASTILCGCGTTEISAPISTPVKKAQVKQKVLKASLVKARLAPYRTAQGESAQEVLIDWKNVGNATITVVHADIVAYDRAGNVLGSSASDYTVFASSVAGGVKPGRIYHEPRGDGFVLIPSLDGHASRVSVRITRAG